MASYPYTGTLFDSEAVTGAKTRTALSTQIIVYVNNQPVGAIQSFEERQQRSIKRIFEVGTDGTVEAVPQSAATIDLTVNRIVFDGLSLPEAMARGFRNIHSQRIPFDIVVIDRFTGTEEEGGAIVTTYHNCWFGSLGRSYSVNDYTIAENASITVESVSTERNGAPVASSQGVGGGRDLGSEGRQIDAIEQAADYGTYRGSLDFPGLIKAAF
jgi:hypothetical protein